MAGDYKLRGAGGVALGAVSTVLQLGNLICTRKLAALPQKL